MKKNLMQKMTTAISVAAALTISPLQEASANVLALSGASIYDVDSSGTYIGNGSDTTGSNGVYNLYLLSDTGSFLNGGDGSTTALSQSISNPGTYTFLFRMDGGGFNWPSPFAGLNLFFNNSTNPEISASVPFNVPNPTLAAFGNNSLGIMSNNVTGANSLSFMANGFEVALTAFQMIDYLNPAVIPTIGDLVSPLDNVPNGINDYSGMITLQVSSGQGQAVPEPGTLALTGLALGCVVIAQRRRKPA